MFFLLFCLLLLLSFDDLILLLDLGIIECFHLVQLCPQVKVVCLIFSYFLLDEVHFLGMLAFEKILLKCKLFLGLLNFKSQFIISSCKFSNVVFILVILLAIPECEFLL